MIYGHIERIDEGVAWGQLDTGRTFDFPVDTAIHKVGDKVMHSVVEEGEIGKMGYTDLWAIMGEEVCTLFFCEATDEGIEILSVDHVAKALQ